MLEDRNADDQVVRQPTTASTDQPQHLTPAGESPNLDVLRALAVMLVLVAHVVIRFVGTCRLDDNKRLLLAPIDDTPAVALAFMSMNSLGALGVLLFFVHTSLVLLMSLERTKSAGLFTHFYMRRAFRIYPLALTCMVLVLAMRIPMVPTLDYVEHSWRDVVANAFLVQNLLTNVNLIATLEPALGAADVRRSASSFLLYPPFRLRCRCTRALVRHHGRCAIRRNRAICPLLPRRCARLASEPAESSNNFGPMVAHAPRSCSHPVPPSAVVARR